MTTIDEARVAIREAIDTLNRRYVETADASEKIAIERARLRFRPGVHC